MGEAKRRQDMGFIPRNINVKAEDLQDRVCECRGKIFTDAIRLKEIPMVVTGGRAETMMIKIGFICVKCGKLMSLRPEAPKQEESKILLTDGGRA
jgi:hypothetical protein